MIYRANFAYDEEGLNSMVEQVEEEEEEIILEEKEQIQEIVGLFI